MLKNVFPFFATLEVLAVDALAIWIAWNSRLKTFAILFKTTTSLATAAFGMPQVSLVTFYFIFLYCLLYWQSSYHQMSLLFHFADQFLIMTLIILYVLWFLNNTKFLIWANRFFPSEFLILLFNLLLVLGIGCEYFCRCSNISYWYNSLANLRIQIIRFVIGSNFGSESIRVLFKNIWNSICPYRLIFTIIFTISAVTVWTTVFSSCKALTI